MSLNLPADPVNRDLNPISGETTMLCKKGICLFLFVTAVLLLATAPGRCQRENLDQIRADGGAPPPPPIPWFTDAGAIDTPQLNADGVASKLPKTLPPFLFVLGLGLDFGRIAHSFLLSASQNVWVRLLVQPVY